MGEDVFAQVVLEELSSTIRSLGVRVFFKGYSTREELCTFVITRQGIAENSQQCQALRSPILCLA